MILFGAFNHLNGLNPKLTIIALNKALMKFQKPL